MPVNATDVSAIPGLKELWAETRGDPRVCIAVLDGPVDLSHDSLARANVTQLKSLVSRTAKHGAASQHGTHVASVIFGQHDGPVKGIAPGCRGLIVPIFSDGVDGRISCSQIDLARGITQAVQDGAHIINISGGELSPSGSAHPILSDAVENSARAGVLIVAAAGNEGCDCLHVPGALPSVMAVGALDSEGKPLEQSNWGDAYQTQGILAPGQNIRGAIAGGGITTRTGTSSATPVLSGVVGLLLSLQLKYGCKLDAHTVHKIIIDQALGRDHGSQGDRRRLLSGRLNIRGAASVVAEKEQNTMIDRPDIKKNEASSSLEDLEPTAPESQTQFPAAEAVAPDFVASDVGSDAAEPPPPTAPVNTDDPLQQLGTVVPQSDDATQVAPSTWCPVCADGTSKQLVYALGQLGSDFGTEARRDSIAQNMDPPANPDDARHLLSYLENNPWDAASIHWTLNFDLTTVYAIAPAGPFASEIGQRLRQFLEETVSGEVERISIPGVIVGNATLLNGQVVPVIVPELRGMFSWTTTALLKAVCGNAPAANASKAVKDAYSRKVHDVRNFLDRVYYERRNLGMTPQERAMNFAATNAFQIEKIYESVMKEEMELDSIEVERSPICRPDSDCWDVKLIFFTPKDPLRTSRQAHRFTVDVSDVVPVTIGPTRCWNIR